MRNVERWLALLALTSACSQGVPASVPATSAASERATAAPLPVVGVALHEDPPPPGTKSDHWPGLDDADAGATMPPMPGM